MKAGEIQTQYHTIGLKTTANQQTAVPQGAKE